MIAFNYNSLQFHALPLLSVISIFTVDVNELINFVAKMSSSEPQGMCVL